MQGSHLTLRHFVPLAGFVLLLSGTVAVTLTIYQLAVRPFGPTRYLAGMKPLSRRAGVAESPGRPAAALGRS